MILLLKVLVHETNLFSYGYLTRCTLKWPFLLTNYQSARMTDYVCLKGSSFIILGPSHPLNCR